LPHSQERKSRKAAIPERHVNCAPMLRFGNPDEPALTTLFLASCETSFMTGSDVVVDGVNDA
jgi:NAD(P)-dependent dehydrogenase (short-subunit alcohol dehydrogenase family)